MMYSLQLALTQRQQEALLLGCMLYHHMIQAHSKRKYNMNTCFLATGCLRCGAEVMPLHRASSTVIHMPKA